MLTVEMVHVTRRSERIPEACCFADEDALVLIPVGSLGFLQTIAGKPCFGASLSVLCFVESVMCFVGRVLWFIKSPALHVESCVSLRVLFFAETCVSSSSVPG